MTYLFDNLLAASREKRQRNVVTGMEFSDEEHNRNLTVHSQCKIDPEYWYCSVQVVEVLYRYKDTFILGNLS